MRHLKIHIALLIVVILCVGLSGCGNKKDTSITKKEAPTFKITGVKDYKVVTDDKIALKSSVTKESINALGNLSLALQGRSSKKGSLDDLPNISYLELRDVGHLAGKRAYYCMFAKGSSKLYIFFYEDEEYDHHLIILGTCCKSRTLTFQDFDSLKSGISTMQDVEKIDPVRNAFPFYSGINAMDVTLDSEGKTAFHMVKGGIVKITYQKKNGNSVVKSINKMESPLVQVIDALDW